MSLDYTLAVTSCDRHDLLARTIESFFEHVDIEPAHTMILEDGQAIRPSWMDADEWYTNEGSRLGQIKSCDRLMSLVETEWVFWCEDDWLFKEGDFVQRSYDILSGWPEVVTVSLRGRPWNQPLVGLPQFPFLVAEPGWQGGWGNFAFNPGLRRRSDWVKMGPYADLGGTDMYACQSELAISRAYAKAGYYIADLGRPIIEHLGHGRSKTKEAF